MVRVHQVFLFLHLHASRIASKTYFLFKISLKLDSIAESEFMLLNKSQVRCNVHEEIIKETFAFQENLRLDVHVCTCLCHN